MASCNSWQYLVTILAKIFPRSWQDLAKILLRYPWRVDPGAHGLSTRVQSWLNVRMIDSKGTQCENTSSKTLPENPIDFNVFQTTLLLY